MVLYLIGGLGADKRIFDFLSIDSKTKVIEWIEPLKDESIDSYIERLSSQMDVSEKFGIVGVSFGGIIAVELSKILNPAITILISSVECSCELPMKYLNIGKSGILRLIPNSLIKPPQFILNYMFGAINKALLKEIIIDTDPHFIRWALQTIVEWKSDLRIVNCIRIHGTNDKLIPLKGHAMKIDKGAHFMIVDRAVEVSRIINGRVKFAEENF